MLTLLAKGDPSGRSPGGVLLLIGGVYVLYWLFSSKRDD